MSKTKMIAVFLFLSALAVVAAPSAYTQKEASAQSTTLEVPRVWNDSDLASYLVPFADPKASATLVPSSFYYSIHVRKLYKSYPVYAPGREPQGYMEWLKQQEPQLAFDPSKLKTTADWIKAGEAIFDAPISLRHFGQATLAEVQDMERYAKVGMPMTKDGTIPMYSFVIVEKGKVELGESSCATCHTRVLEDGTVIKGAQGNLPLNKLAAMDLRSRAANTKDAAMLKQQMSFGTRVAFSVPWLESDPHAMLDGMSFEESASYAESIPSGVATRGSAIFPPQIPDLIGVKDRRYLDHTGQERHRTIADLMRYAVLVSGGEVLFYRFGDFVPVGRLPEAKFLDRFSDEQLYALALYIYSLKPPPNPNKFDKLAQRGQQVFNREGCATCHTPPLYTNNKLTPVEGYKPPESHLKQVDVLNISVGTDPGLALQTRKATGFYKVPSLKGVWYRGPFEHNGSVATLEDWFDPRRLKDDYVPTGFRGFKAKTRAVRGHEFGLKISEADRKALIAFLKTL